VLVTNWEPNLDVFVFSQAYLKMCSEQFSMSQLDDVYRHLANYSIQKTKEDKINIVMSSSEFAEQNQICWETEILPKIKSLAYRALKGLQETQTSECNNCFEVYGFDLVLDESY